MLVILLRKLVNITRKKMQKGKCVEGTTYLPSGLLLLRYY